MIFVWLGRRSRRLLFSDWRTDKVFAKIVSFAPLDYSRLLVVLDMIKRFFVELSWDSVPSLLSRVLLVWYAPRYRLVNRSEVNIITDLSPPVRSSPIFVFLTNGIDLINFKDIHLNYRWNRLSKVQLAIWLPTSYGRIEIVNHGECSIGQKSNPDIGPT